MKSAAFGDAGRSRACVRDGSRSTLRCGREASKLGGGLAGSREGKKAPGCLMHGAGIPGATMGIYLAPRLLNTCHYLVDLEGTNGRPPNLCISGWDPWLLDTWMKTVLVFGPTLV